MREGDERERGGERNMKARERERRCSYGELCVESDSEVARTIHTPCIG